MTEATQFAPHLEKHLQLETLHKLKAHIEEELDNEIYNVEISQRELTVCCKKSEILKVLKFLRDDKKCQFRMLLDVCGVDYPEREARFDVVYHMLSVQLNHRIRVKLKCAEGDAVLSSTDLFPSAGWYERETYDMFGVKFENHPDLRRILTDYDFDGHPLRKDFPVEGNVEVYYDEEEKRVAYKPVDMPQEYRHFDQQSSWKGMTGNAYLGEEATVGRNTFSEEEFNEEESEEKASA